MKPTLIICILLCAPALYAQEEDSTAIDPSAVYLLDHMTDVIGQLTSCSYTLQTSQDTEHYKFGMVKNFATHEVYMVGPDKMTVQSKTEKNHHGYWYNGTQIAYYSYSENNFAIIPAPNNIMSTIDSVHTNYDVNFPAADFFYPTFSDDLLDNFSSINYIGTKQVEGKDCFHISATNETTNVQIWLADDAFNLPVKLVITDKSSDIATQYEATFSSWSVNPDLPFAMFEFVPPPGSHEILLVSKKALN